MQAIQCIIRRSRHYTFRQRLIRSATSLKWERRFLNTEAYTHLFTQVLANKHNVAFYENGVKSVDHTEWTYDQLMRVAVKFSRMIEQALPMSVRFAIQSGEQPRIAFLGNRDISYTIMQWSIWLAGGIAVPLHPSHPPDELNYIVEDCGASLLLVSEALVKESPNSQLVKFIEHVQSQGKLVVMTCEQKFLQDSQLEKFSINDDVNLWVSETSDKGKKRPVGSYIVYTSGTTGRPKGVVTTHNALMAQIHDIVTSWEMHQNDHALHFLPLHHVHGIVNNLLCMQYVGGSVEMLPNANPSAIWSKLAAHSDCKTKRPTMLMAVPTVYMNLLEEFEKNEKLQPEKRMFDVDDARIGAVSLRVAISGSMSCPVSILNRWHALTGHRLLERYGMTELGMVLTNPLHGERHLGYVGQPFPSVEVRVVDIDESGEEKDVTKLEQEGELRVKGPTVFHEYWGRPDATSDSFDAQGWFKTGDIVQYNSELDSFRIRGRASADIIKSAGNKISALDIERVLLSHPQVQECAVFGLDDEKWGQVVAALIRSSSKELTPSVSEYCKPRLADNSTPRKVWFVSEIPKNAMGKVNKKALAITYSNEDFN